LVLEWLTIAKGRVTDPLNLSYLLYPSDSIIFVPEIEMNEGALSPFFIRHG